MSQTPSNLSKFSQNYINPNKQAIISWLNQSDFAKTLLANIKSLDQFSNNYNGLISQLYNQFITENKQLNTTRKDGVPTMGTPSHYFMDVVQEYLKSQKPTISSKSTLDLFFNK